MPPADEETLESSSERIVDEAHNIVKKKGRTVLEELKTAKEEFLKAYRSKDKK
jgi:predicted nucleic acid-binding Zn finger protein